MKKFYSCEKGFTLVELIIAMAISIMAIVAIMQLSKSSNEVFKRSEDISQKQMNVRLASFKAVEALRFAKFPSGIGTIEFIEFTDPNPTPGIAIKPDHDCIYFDDNEKTLFHMDKTGKRWKLLDMKLDTDQDKSYFELGADKLISFKITEETDDYSIESKIKLLNAENDQFPIITYPKKYKGIKFIE